MAAALALHPSSLSRPLRRGPGPLGALFSAFWRSSSLPAFATSRLAVSAGNEHVQTASPSAFSWPTSLALPSLLAPLLELFPSIVLAVPKKKVSHSRKSMRSANKGLKDKTSTYLAIFYFSFHFGPQGPVNTRTHSSILASWSTSCSSDFWSIHPDLMWTLSIFVDIVACPACGGPKLSHHLCPTCTSQLLRGFKANNQPPPAGP